MKGSRSLLCCLFLCMLRRADFLVAAGYLRVALFLGHAVVASSFLLGMPHQGEMVGLRSRSPSQNWKLKAARISASMSLEQPEIPESLARIFKEEHAGRVAQLSDTAVVDLLSAETSTSSAGDAPLRQQIFTSPFIPFIYERVLPPVWAAGLRVGGMDEEYAEVADFLQCDGTGTVLDLSCGTGFIARRLAAARSFQHVVALDYSNEMLSEFLAELDLQRKGWRPPNLERGRLSIVRGNALELPFKDASLDAVHWGAAMHCVPDAEKAMSEVQRVLKPGGKLYATTFLRPLPDVVFRFFSLEELRMLAAGAGFGLGEGSAVEVRRLGPVYGVIRAVK